MCDKKYEVPFYKEPVPLWWRVASMTEMNIVGSLCKCWCKFLTRTKVYHSERLTKLIEENDRPIITVAIHHSNIDDPLIFGMLGYRRLL